MNMIRSIYRGLLLLFLILLPAQFLFAGYGVFSGKYDAHEAFGAGLLHGIMLLFTLAALISKQWRAALLSFIVFAVVFLQIGLVSIGRDNDMPWISALHPFLAFCYWPYVYFLLWRPAQAARATDSTATTTAPA